VTKDKRAKAKKNWLCWAVCIALLLGIIIIAILAACKLPQKLRVTLFLTNLIFSQPVSSEAKAPNQLNPPRN
jgi:hypothetical protein